MAVLGEVVIARNSVSPIPSGNPNPPPIEPLLISLDLSPLNLFFQTGELVAFNFSSIGANDSIAFAVMGNFGPGGSVGPYANGQAFRRSPTNEFFPWDAGTVEVGPVDLGFRTYVNVVPEPNNLVIMSLLTCGSIFAAQRRSIRRAHRTS
jgi:hypothetical protein